MRRVIIENAAILTCDPADRYIPRGRIAIEGGRIARIEDAPGAPPGGPASAPRDAREEGGERVDAAGRVVLPGLINTHTHLWLSLLRGVSDDLTLFPWLRALGPRTSAMDEPALLRATYFGLAESLRSGTTCVCECCRYAPDLTARVADELGCRVVVGGMPPSEMFGEPVPHDYPRLVSAARAAAERHRDGKRLVSPWLGAHSVYNCSAEFLRTAKRQADACGYDFYIHLAECRDEVEWVRQRTGRTPVQYAADLGLLDPRTVAVHCVWLTDDDVRVFRESGARIAHCPVSNAKLASGVAPIERYRRAGIAVGLGTDSMVSNNTLSMFQEMRFAVLIQRAAREDVTALRAGDALRMATCDAARVVGLEHEIGSIEEGKRADLVVLRSTHPGPLTRDVAVSDVVYAAQRDEIEAVYVEGERVLDRGRLTRIDDTTRRLAARGP
jgi:5-methylthioadenosine/S-adenosylhomocysteine deaminase